MEKGRFIIIEEWMWELGLSANEQMVVGFIHGYCKHSKQHSYEGGLAGISKVLNTSARGAWNIIEKLCSKGIITKTNSVVSGTQMHSSYRISPEYCNPIEKTSMAIEKFSMAAIEKTSMYKEIEKEKKKSSCSCKNTHAREDNNDNNNDPSDEDSPETKPVHTESKPMTEVFRMNRHDIDKSQVRYLDYVDDFRQRHPRIKLYDNTGHFYSGRESFLMSQYPDWPKMLYKGIDVMFKGYRQVEMYLQGIAEAFNESMDKIQDYFPEWCYNYGVDKVCYDIPDLYEKRDQYHGTTLNNAARAFFRQPAKERIPNITNV